MGILDNLKSKMDEIVPISTEKPKLPKIKPKQKKSIQKRITTAQFTLDPLGTVQKLIREWRPKNYRYEKDWENNLKRYLESRLSRSIITQYGVPMATARADIVVGGKVLIELKINMDRGKYNNLIGQIEDSYKPFYDNIIILLCGKNDYTIVHRLKKKYGGFLSQFDTKKVIVMEKTAS